MLLFRRLLFACALIAFGRSVQAQTPAIAAGGVLNAADGSREIAPGSFFSIYGSSLASQTSVAPSFPLPDVLGSVSVDVIDAGNTLAAPIWFISPTQINAQMPFGLSGAAVQVRVRSAGGSSNTETATIVPRAPRFFTKDTTGQGEAILLHLDYTMVSQASPAFPGEVVFGYMNALGAVTPALAAGQPGVAAAPLNTADPVQISVGGGPAQASSFAGMAPNFLVYQVNFTIPANTPVGKQSLVVMAGATPQSPDTVNTYVGRNFRTAQAEAPYLNCRGTEFYKDPNVIFPVTCPSTPVSNTKNSPQFQGAVPLTWNQAGTTFSATGRIAGIAASDHCDVSITGQLDAAAQTVTTAHFEEQCHTEEPATSLLPALVRDTDQGYTFANVPVAGTNTLGYALLYGVSGANARAAVTDARFNMTLKKTDGSPYMSWELLLPVPAAGPTDVTQLGFVR